MGHIPKVTWVLHSIEILGLNCQVQTGQGSGDQEEGDGGRQGGDHLQVWPPQAGVSGCSQDGDSVPLQCLQVMTDVSQCLVICWIPADMMRQPPCTQRMPQPPVLLQ